MTQRKRIDDDMLSFKTSPEPSREISEEDYEDHLDYCAAIEAIDEALEKGQIKRTRDFAKELGLDY
jgi:hypothetical protein